MVPFRVFAVAVVVCAVGSVGAFSQQLVVTATDGNDLLMREYAVDHHRLEAVRSSVTGLATPGQLEIVAHALVVRSLGGDLLLDVYYGVCIPKSSTDQDCASQPSLSMKRMGSNLELLGGRDFAIAVDPPLASETLRTRSGWTSRLLLQAYGLGIAERELGADGTPGSPIFPKASSAVEIFTPSEDGRVLGSLDDLGVYVQRFHPRGPVSGRYFPYSSSLSISGPVKRPGHGAGSKARTSRFAFVRDSGESQVFALEIDDATMKFTERYIAVTEPRADPDSTYLRQSVAVSPGADMVFYSEWNPSCGKWLLWGQAFDPVAFKKVGKAQLLIRCSELPATSVGIRDIDVAELTP